MAMISKESFSIPPGRGLNDLAEQIAGLLSRVRVKSVEVDHNGVITYTKVTHPGDPPDPPPVASEGGLVSAYSLFGTIPDKVDLGDAPTLQLAAFEALREADRRSLVPHAFLLHPEDRKSVIQGYHLRPTLLGVPVIEELRTSQGRIVLFAGIDLPGSAPTYSILSSNLVILVSYPFSEGSSLWARWITNCKSCPP